MIKPWTRQDFICCFYNVHVECELTCSKSFGLLITEISGGTLGALCTIYRVTSYLRSSVLSILICSPNMNFLVRLVSDNSRSLENLSWGHCLTQPPLNKHFLHEVWVLVHSYLCVRFDLPGSINFRDINCFPKLEAQNPYYSSPQKIQNGTIGMISY